MSDAAVRRSALAIATLSAFVTPFMGSSINVALPSIQRSFRVDAIELSWIPTLYLLAAAVCLVPFGRLADIYGRKRVYTIGITLFSLSSLLCGLSRSLGMLLGARILQGVGSAMIFATGIAVLTSVFPPDERGRVLGWTVASVYVGLSLGPTIGGLLTQQLGWRAVFLVVVPLGLGVIPLVAWRLEGEWADAAGEPFDLAGSLIYGTGIVALVYGFSVLPRAAAFPLMAGGLAALAGFALWESRISHPVFEIGLFRRNRLFALSCLAALVNYGATFAVTFLLSLYLQYIKALTPQQAGLLLVSQPLMMALLSPAAGRLSDRIEPRLVASSGMALTALALVAFATLDRDSGLPLIVGRLVLLGIGLALFSSPNTNAIMGSVERRFYGIASGSVGTMRLLGQMLSMGIATMVFALVIGRVEITPERYPAFVNSAKLAFALFGGLCIAGVFASLARGRLRAQ